MAYLSVLTFWQWIGIVLVAWVVWDLVTGRVYFHRGFDRREEPLYYWVTMFLWGGIAVSCLWSPYVSL